MSADTPVPRRPAARFFAAIAVTLCAGLPAPAQEPPLSAIDWLSRSVSRPGPDEVPAAGQISEGIRPETIRVTPLGAPSPDAAGLLPAERAGLPADLWGPGPAEALARRLRALPADTLPAARDLTYSLLLAELAPPADTGDAPGALFLARIDKLLDFGAVDQALALLETAGAESSATFRRRFDAALLVGREDRACTAMEGLPATAPSYPARIFCLARGGDWSAADLTLRGARALGLLDPLEDALLSRFLDPEAPIPDGDMPAPPAAPSPLEWRLFEAIGAPIPTGTLPVAFAHADLRGVSGWRAQIAAAERLARTGAVTPNRLLGLYTARRPAASGGLWERVAAVQLFETALATKDADELAAALRDVWPHMVAAELEGAFAALYAPRLRERTLPRPAAGLAFEIALLAGDPETAQRAARAHDPADARETFLAALARGRPDAAEPPDALAAAIAEAFDDDAPIDAAQRARLDSGRRGEALLAALDTLALGAAGDLRAVTEALAALQALDQRETARRAALELMLLERRG